MWLGASSAWAILGVEELKPGMKGVGRTVFQGTEIDTFDFEIVDILHTEGYVPDLILIRVSGEKIDQIGGICAGMSGSPLLINDQLIGAIAFTTPMSDTHYGFATPIKDMLKVFDFEQKAGKEEKKEPLPGERIGSVPRVLDLLPVQTPVMVCGLRGRAFDLLARRLRSHRLRVVESGLMKAEVPVSPEPLRPGSAIGLSLTTGDVVLMALGTLTYRQGPRILAFGHPFLQRGDTSLFLVPAYIYQVVRSLDMPFKIGAPAGDPVGAITQDRAAGVGGRLQMEVDFFNLEVQVTDTDLSRNRTMKIQIVRDPVLAPSLVAVCLLQALDETLDRVGQGTARLSWKIKGVGLTQAVQRTDMFYSQEDVSLETVAGLMSATDALLQNEFHEIRLDQVGVEVNVERQRRTARITALEVSPQKLPPGQEIQLKVALQPYRGTPETHELRLTVPEDFAAERGVIVLHGREASPVGTLSWEALASATDPPRSLEELLQRLENAPRGNDLVAELLTPEMAEIQHRAAIQLARPETEEWWGEEPIPPLTLPRPPGLALPRSRARAQLTTAYVIEGRVEKEVTIVRPAK